MSQGRRGANAERKSREILERVGIMVVRSAASKSPIDLVAWNDRELVLIQVKSGRKPRPSELKDFIDAPTPPGAAKLLHHWPKGAKEPTVTVITDRRTA